jgi:hypothetical protein
MLGVGLMISWMGRTDRRDTRLYCPHCQKRLNRGVEYAGFCASCGEKALVMPEEPASLGTDLQEPSLMKVEDFNSACHSYLKRIVTWIGILFLGCLLYFILISAVIVNWRDPISDWVSQRFHTDRPQDVYVNALLPCLLIFPGGLIFLAIRDRKRGPDPRISCPQCRKDLTQGRWWVVATRRCSRCGTSVLADPDDSAANAPAPQLLTTDPPNARPPIALEDFRADVRSYRRWIVIL